MTQADVIEQYKKSAADSWDTAEKLLTSEKYHHSLFFIHLAIEKLLKALYQQKNHDPAPPLHNLSRLAELSGLNPDENLKDQLNEVSTYNIAARYDDNKLSFYKKATKEYTDKWVSIAKGIYQILLKQLK